MFHHQSSVMVLSRSKYRTGDIIFQLDIVATAVSWYFCCCIVFDTLNSSFEKMVLWLNMYIQLLVEINFETFLISLCDIWVRIWLSPQRFVLRTYTFNKHIPSQSQSRYHLGAIDAVTSTQVERDTLYDNGNNNISIIVGSLCPEWNAACGWCVSGIK